MKFNCSQQVLSRALNTVSKAVSTRSALPVLKGILLKTEGNNILSMSASDMDISIVKKIEVFCEEEGAVVVSSKLFGDIIRKLPGGDVSIQTDEENNVTVKTSFSEFNIVGLSPDEFPKIKDTEEETYKITLDKDMFSDMIRKTSFAASIDESKGIITGVLAELEDEKFNMAALDGFRMSVVRERIDNTGDKKVVISGRLINEIKNIISDSEDDDTVEITVGTKNAVFTLKDTRAVVRLLEGEFINYRSILPQEGSCIVTADRRNLLDSIERASLLAKEGKNNLIKLSFNNDLLLITSRSEEGNVKEEIIVEKEGNDIEIGFNSKYLIDALKVIDDDRIKLLFNGSTSPCLIRPLEGDKYEYLILPVRLSS